MKTNDTTAARIRIKWHKRDFKHIKLVQYYLVIKWLFLSHWQWFYAGSIWLVIVLKSWSLNNIDNLTKYAFCKCGASITGTALHVNLYCMCIFLSKDSLYPKKILSHCIVLALHMYTICAAIVMPKLFYNIPKAYKTKNKWQDWCEDQDGMR